MTTHCIDCRRPMRPKGTSLESHPGTTTSAGVRCSTCYGRHKGYATNREPRSAVCERCGIVEIVSSKPRSRKYPLCADCRGALTPVEREAWAA